MRQCDKYNSRGKVVSRAEGGGAVAAVTGRPSWVTRASIQVDSPNAVAPFNLQQKGQVQISFIHLLEIYKNMLIVFFLFMF